MARFEEYVGEYQSVSMERRNGIVQVTLHTDGGPLQWGGTAASDLLAAFSHVGGDTDNKVVILTGAGDFFSVRRRPWPTTTAEQWNKIYWEGKRLLWSLLDIEVPVISAINGPPIVHSELPLLCDIVLAAEEATFQDGHFNVARVPGDGSHVVYPLLLGLNRARYFLLTGQTLSARQALELGLVNEVLPREQLLPRAWQLAELLVQRPPLVLRYSRVLLTQQIRHQMNDLLGYGLALEGLEFTDQNRHFTPTKW